VIWAWLVVAAILAIAEMLTTAFAAVFLAAGAVAAALAAALGAGLVLQALAFAAVSILGIFGVRPVLVRYRETHKSEILASGAEAMIGQTATVVEATAGRQAWGHVRIGGESWPAVSSDGSPLQEGEEVVVKELRNTSLVVSPTRLGKRPGHS
jgi:membrane protein implicated in regulation of membrane protease activity